MPNIWIVGFKKKEAKNIRSKIDKLMVEDLSRGHDAITTIFSAKTKWCAENKRAPHLVVRDTNLATARAIAKIIRKKLGLDAEGEKIDFFLEGKPAS